MTSPGRGFRNISGENKLTCSSLCEVENVATRISWVFKPLGSDELIASITLTGLIRKRVGSSNPMTYLSLFKFTRISRGTSPSEIAPLKQWLKSTLRISGESLLKNFLGIRLFWAYSSRPSRVTRYSFFPVLRNPDAVRLISSDDTT